MKHTPGPWFEATQNDALYVIAGDPPSLNNDYPNHNADRKVIAKVYGDRDTRLIAAAPELLEALKETVEFLNGFSPGIGMIAKSIEVARAVIAKTEGEQP